MNSWIKAIFIAGVVGLSLLILIVYINPSILDITGTSVSPEVQVLAVDRNGNGQYVAILYKLEYGGIIGPTSYAVSIAHSMDSISWKDAALNWRGEIKDIKWIDDHHLEIVHEGIFFEDSRKMPKSWEGATLIYRDMNSSN